MEVEKDEADFENKFMAASARLNDLDPPSPEAITLKQHVPSPNLPAVMGLLAQDPRPAYQHDGKRVYGVPYGEVDIRFVVEGDTLTVVEVVPYTEKEQKK